ncbi:alpha/beta-hydrolase [Daldinia sp. FL1419]|nr:alpha/beta-hydrolase [Daldinia sp. FL1419]
MATNTEASLSTPHRREVFYAGGHYAQDDAGKNTRQGQMYVERLTPIDPNKPSPIIFIHGATRSGTDWLTKPDGQPGWASYFLSRGFECYLVDLPFCGRSPWHPKNGVMIAHPAEAMQTMFTACKDFGTWPQAKLHTQWPGTGKISDPIFDQFFASAQQILNDPVAQELASQAAAVALLDRIGKPAILIGHSAGGSTPWLVADIRPDLVKMIVALEPAGPPFYKVGMKSGPSAPYGIANAPLTYSPPVTNPHTDFAKVLIKAPDSDMMDCLLQAEGEGEKGPRRLVNLSDVRVLVVTAQASYHAQYDWAIVRYLRQAGVKEVVHLKLEDRGIYGNGHMMFMERNSDAVVAEVVKWIEENT